MVDVSRREKWEREFDDLAVPGGFISGLASSRKPNSADVHVPGENVIRAERLVVTVVDALLRATRRLSSSTK